MPKTLAYFASAQQEEEYSSLPWYERTPHLTLNSQAAFLVLRVVGSGGSVGYSGVPA